MKAAFAVLTLVALVAAVFGPAVPQPLSYHDFADCRPWLSIPNFLNVASNVPFFAFGAWGLWLVARAEPGRFHEERERLAYMFFFIGAMLTCFGSIWYHLGPNNSTLVWDRLPMTMAFAGLVAAVLGERVDPRLGRLALWPLLVIGAGSVLYWYATERAGAGNLTPYGVLQAWAIAIVFVAAAGSRRARYTRAGWLWWPVALYGLAKVTETFDLQIYRLTEQAVSGHTLKHLLAAAAVGAVAWMLHERRPVAQAAA